MAAPMSVDSGCGSGSEEEFRPREMVVLPFGAFHRAIRIIEQVQNFFSNSVIWNKQQCKRIVDRYILIAKQLKRMDSDGNSVGSGASDGGSSSTTEVDDELLRVLQKGETLILGYDKSQGITNVISRTNNQEAFAEHHEELDAVVAKVGLQLPMEDATEFNSGTEKMNFPDNLKADAVADKEEMPKILSQMSESVQSTDMSTVEKLAQVLLEKTTDVDVKKLVSEDNPEKLPSYLKISPTEIDIGDLVRSYERKSKRDPMHKVGWAFVRTGKWLNYNFAIKVFNCGADDGSQVTWNQKQLLMEAGSLVELQHPHVVRLVGFGVGFGQDAKQSVFVMELMDNNLREFMDAKPKPGKPFTDSEELDVIIQIAKGMCFIHGKEYVHGDLKCSNVMVKKYGQYLEVKIGDLRGSQKYGEWNAEAFKQACETRRPRWTAPEAIGHDGQEKPSWEFLKQIDVYSFGMTCYEIVTGSLPFHGIRDEDELVKMIQEGDRPVLSEALDSNLRGLITSCWDKDPEKRPSFEIICQVLASIRSKTPALEKDRSYGLAVVLAQFKDNLVKWVWAGDEQSKISRTYYAPEQLRIPEYLKINPKQLKRGDCIGSGSSARVFKTTWLHCTFAEKIVKKSMSNTEFVQQEINSLIKISRHPFIAQLMGLSINPESGECSIIMEYMDGNLRKLIDTRMRKRKGAIGTRTRPFDLHEELHIISKIALGMAYLHSRNVVHRDLKPANVLAQEYFGTLDVKIVDFGLSHLEEPLEPSDAQALDGYYMGWGTGFYRAPEMLPNTDPVLSKEELLKLRLPDPSLKPDLPGMKATDVFSFAMTCYEILTGISPCSNLPAKAYAEVRSKGYRPKWPVNSELEQKRMQLMSLVEGCWNLVPEERPTFDDICKKLSMINSQVDLVKY